MISGAVYTVRVASVRNKLLRGWKLERLLNDEMTYITKQRLKKKIAYPIFMTLLPELVQQKWLSEEFVKDVYKHRAARG